MGIYTTYLAFLKKGVAWKDNKPWAININHTFKKATFYYVMTHRGNDEVAPDPNYLKNVKALVKAQGDMTHDLWESYEKNYLLRIGLSKDAQEWMKRVAEESLKQDIVLVCFEKPNVHCHRTLLAAEIAEKYPPAVYCGELHLFP